MAVSALALAPTGELSMECLSSDTKPLPRLNDTIIEKDTGRIWLGNGSIWVCTSDATYASATQGAAANSALQPGGSGSSLTGLTKAQVGLGSADNTADSAKPVSTAQQTALNAKAASGHNHSGTYEPANTNIQAHVASAHAPSNAQKNSDITLAEIEAKLIGSISSHSHAGGSDPWTTVKLASDFLTGSATAVNVTGLDFTPVLNTRYEFEALLLLRTATATVNPRAGLAWPTGMTDGVALICESQVAAGVPLFAAGNPNAALLCAAGGLPNATQSWPATIKGTALAGATPSGAIRVQLASETAATNVTVKAGSFLKYRVIP